MIKGISTGTTAGTDHFGFVTQEIGAFHSAGAKLTLTRGPSNDTTDLPFGPTGDLQVREVS